MSDRSLIAAGAIGAVLCCATPLLTVVLGGLGLTAWLASADYVFVIAALLLGVALVSFALYRRRAAAWCCDAAAKDKGSA